MATLSSLKIASFNANGLGNNSKRKDVFDYLRKQDLDIVLLQETHFKSEQENFIRSNWGYECFISGNSSNQGGVAILFNNTFEFKLHSQYKSDNGNFIVLDLEILNKRLSLVNLYGPSNNDSPTFFESVFDKIKEFGNEDIIIGGDWNVYLNPLLDTSSNTNPNYRQNSRRCIQNSMTELNLIDIFRYIYPDKKRYSWRRFNSSKQSRLDFFLISYSLTSEISSSNINIGYRSDHSIVVIGIKKYSEKPDKQFWKSNNSLLYDKTYVDTIKAHISMIKKQYALPVYNFECLDEIDNDSVQLLIDDQLFLEILLMEIRGKTISYSSYKKKKDTELEKQLMDEIETLENKNEINDTNIVELEHKKRELEQIRNNKIQGMIVRSKLQWIEKGEKPSKYFCSLEKRNFISKQLSHLEKEDGSLLTTNKDIIKEVKSFYENLYSFRQVDHINLENIINTPINLDDQEKESLEGNITLEEAHIALKAMNNNKSPGSDGYTCEFFKFFFKDLGHFLVRSFNYGLSSGNMSITQKQGVITCIPKEGRDRKFIKNWRPISLLNTSYKIASACIANRLKRFLHKLIHPDQKGFISGRFIGDNIRQLYDILCYTEEKNIPGLLLLIDFEKAFDSISWHFVHSVLEYLNFGPSLRSWIKSFYNNISSCVSINGKYSTWFSICRGVRQGDPLSPYLYLLCAEILAILLRENDDIKGIKINEKDVLLSMFADDTGLCLDGSERSFKEAINVLMSFAKISGLKINYDKTQVIWIGSEKNSDVRFLRDKNFCWDPGIFKYLGITFSTNINEITNLNYEGKLIEIHNLLNKWKKRQLTPFGKITVIKTLALSKITHLFMSIPDPSNTFLRELDQMLFYFLWNYKPSKIKRKVVCKSYMEGGLKMVDVYSFLSTMKLNWMKRIFLSKDQYEITVAMYPCIENVKNYGNCFSKDLCKNIQNLFWSDVLKHFYALQLKCMPNNVNEFNSECLFHNSNIAIGGTVVCYRQCIDNDIYQVHQLLKENGMFFTFQEFCENIQM